MRKVQLLAVVITMLFLGSCARQVTRISTDQIVDVSGRWNDSDSQLAANALIEQVLGETWIENFKQENGRKPVVIVGLVYNKSHEHIDTNTYIKDMERAFVRSGRVRLVQAGEKREALRKERGDQNEYASKSSAKKWGLELGADFMLQGDISSVVDAYKKTKVNYYQVNMELSNLETNEIVWIGEKKIKKVIKN
ncbi:penicillin-binding protein activator LpoB [Puteibacter caeruleilacunae]|nr:penicillin-binding protein activator LpoB [Puteibacter caeruleilacunae]